MPLWARKLLHESAADIAVYSEFFALLGTIAVRPNGSRRSNQAVDRITPSRLGAGSGPSQALVVIEGAVELKPGRTKCVTSSGGFLLQIKRFATDLDIFDCGRG